MTCRGFTQLLLKVINFLFVLVGLAMIGYGIYMVVTYNNSSSSSASPPPPSPFLPPPPSPSPPPPPALEANVLKHGLRPAWSQERDSVGHDRVGILELRRSLPLTDGNSEVAALSSFWSSIPTAWFLYVFTAVGVVITLITCWGYIAAATENGCCLSCYSFFVGLVIIIELALAAFIFFDESWKEAIPDDATGEFDTIQSFVEDNLDILKWVALGVIVLQAFALLMSVILRTTSSNARREYDSDDEYVAPVRASRQPLLNKQASSGGPGTNATVVEGRPVRLDAWSSRMRERYGLDTSEFSYNPADSKRFPPQPLPMEEKRSWCSIM